MVTDKQPEALRLADELNGIPFIGFFAHGQLGTEDSGLCKEAAAELRRLHEVNAELVESLQYVVTRIHDSEEWWMDVEHKGGFDVEKLEAALAKATGE